ncbi:TlyA family RNA methyltransferase [Pseudokineococcus sp. 1T1Z-3]|uniref:TlyA family RNA methyltransferase n=1 Tax=Pseudokineococcus sp. 1T1Z-3 TaxID=3132745 RepID=UPI0030AEC301
MSAARRQRLDAELVRRGLARSRAEAGDLVEAGAVRVAGAQASKPATQVDRAVAILVAEAEPGAGPEGSGRRWASRGAHKLVGALAAFGDVPVQGRLALDAGASTGGFSDVLLDRGVARVLAVDVGYGQLAWPVRSDERVVVRDRTNVRELAPADVEAALGGLPSLVVADLSFISLRLVLPALAACSAPGADLLLMVKPQFEVGRSRLGAGGVVRDPRARADAVHDVARAGQDVGLAVLGAAASPLPGPSGNVEYFLRLRAPGGPPTSGARGPVAAADLPALAADAVAAGPTGALAASATPREHA